MICNQRVVGSIPIVSSTLILLREKGNKGGVVLATTKKKLEQPEKLTAVQARQKVVELQEKLDKINSYGYCYMCDTHKARDKFYISTDTIITSGITPICKECARKIALRVDKNGEEHEPTKESCQMALRYLNKPWHNAVWDSSVQESENLTAGRTKSTPWHSYIKNIAMGQYNCETYFDSDFFIEKVIYDDEKTVENQINNKDVIDSFEQNKKDVIRLLGYDPFVKEQISDQPFLYSSLIGYLDASEDANEDRLRVSASIEIVKGFNHIEKINDIIAGYMSDVKNMERNIITIKNLEDTKNKITTSVLNLAKDNGISLKHSVNASKGENTWTGKVKKLKEMNLREAEVNLYNAEYIAGMQQVAEISNAAIVKQIRLDENDYNDMIIQQRELIGKYKKISDDFEEKARILLRENLDLKDLLKQNNIDLGGTS